MQFFLAYYDQSLLYDNKKLIEIVSLEYLVDSRNVRALLDNTLYSMYKKTSSKEILSDLFPNNYDGTKMTVKFFISICVNYLNEATGLTPVNMYNFI